MPVMSYFRQTKSIGISFSGKGVSLVVAEKNKGEHKIISFVTKPFSAALFEGDSPELNLAADWIVNEIQNIKAYQAIPVYISMPDPVVYSHTFIFDDLPKKSADEFVEWKLSNLFHLDKNEYGFQNSLISTLDNKKTVLSLALNNLFYQHLAAKLLENHIPLTSINSQASINFNVLYDTYNNECGAHVFVNNDYWSIILWDDNKVLQSIKSKWLNEAGVNENVWSVIVDNLERMIRVHLKNRQNDVVNDIYISGRNADDFIRWAELNKSLHIKSLDLSGKVALSDLCSLTDALVALQ